jgi:hypothetical protein
MQLTRLSTENKYEHIYGFQMNTLYGAVYALNKPFNMYRFDTVKVRNDIKKHVEKCQQQFDQKTLTVLKEKHYKILTRKNIEVIFNLDFVKHDRKQIYYTGNKWYAVITMTDKHMVRGGGLPGESFLGKRKFEENACKKICKPKPLEIPEPDPREFEPGTPTQTEKNVSGFRVCTEEEELVTVCNLEQFTPFLPYKYNDLYNDIFDINGIFEDELEIEIENVSVEPSVDGGYYFSGNRMKNETIYGPNSDLNTQTDHLNCVIAFSDSCHDFNKQYGRERESGLSKADINQYYTKDVIYNNITTTTTTTNTYIKHLFNLSALISAPDSFNIWPKKKEKDPEIREMEISLKLRTAWEAHFLSRFYYSIFPFDQRTLVYKLNIPSTKVHDWLYNFKEFLIKNRYTHYFFDMIIASKEELENYTSYTQMINYLNDDKPTLPAITE